MTVGQAFGKKMGPLPRWGWLVLAAGLVGAYLVYRRRANGTAAGLGDVVQQRISIVPTTSATPDSSNQWNAMGGGMSANAPPSQSLSPDVLSQLGGIDALSTVLADILANQYTDGNGIFAHATGTGTVAPEAETVAVHGPAATSGALPVTTRAATPKLFGGIVSHKKLKSGATLTTYANGRQVEHKPGSSPYVVKA